jgi:hypothetical protein
MKQTRNIFVLAIGVLLVATLANASTLDINADESKLRIGNTVDALGTTFNITGDENLFVQNGDSIYRYRIIFLENLDKIGGLKAQLKTLNQNIEKENNLSYQLQDMIDYKKTDNLGLGARLDSLKKETCILSNQSNQSSLLASDMRTKTADLENRITGNFLISGGQTSALLVIFTILIAAVIVIEFKAYFRPDKTAKADKKE